MKFGGFQKTSLIDFPGKISSILFTTGCNLRCPFCHNWRLIVDPRPPFLSREDVLRVLESRKEYVDAVVITGGEPAMNDDLPDFVKRLKENGFSVKLDTNGFFPEVLERCLPHLDYVAIDVKTSLEKYRLLGATDTDSFLRSVGLVKAGKVEYEFRSTVVPGFIDEADIQKIGEIVRGASLFVFQPFLPGDTLDKRLNELKPYPPEVIHRFAKAMENYAADVMLRI